MRRQIIFLLAAFMIVSHPIDIYGMSMVYEPEREIEEEMFEIKKQNSLDNIVSATDEEIDLIALVCLGEAEGESELGKRLVIDTILNRVESERWPNDISDVCWQRGQYCCLHNGRCGSKLKAKVNDYIRSLVIEEMNNRTNSEVIYFNGAGFSGGHKIHEGGHYFK